MVPAAQSTADEPHQLGLGDPELLGHQAQQEVIVDFVLRPPADLGLNPDLLAIDEKIVELMVVVALVEALDFKGGLDCSPVCLCHVGILHALESG